MSRRSLPGILSVLFMLAAGAGAGALWGSGIPGSQRAGAVGAVCGDGIINWGEHCEDGNTANGDGCNSLCKYECAAASDCTPLTGVVGACFDSGAGYMQTGVTDSDCDAGYCPSTPVPCATEFGLCADGNDNDGDAPVDCADSDCNPASACGGTETACTDHLDNDIDGSTDCADSDCAGNPACGGGGGSGICDNDGTAESGETCANCPRDAYACTANQRCEINDVTLASECVADVSSCSREDVCGDGWVSDEEACDDGGICTGSANAAYEGRDCSDLDPTGELLRGVGRCRATGGWCAARSGDGCSWDCQASCLPAGSPCLLSADCCAGQTCQEGVCGAGGGGATCGNWIVEGAEQCDDGNTVGSDGCNADCTLPNGSCTPCPGCATTATRVIVRSPGIPAAECVGTVGNDCSQYNTDTTLTYYEGLACGGTTCGWCWSTSDLPICTPSDVRWVLQYSTILSRWELRGGGDVLYTLNSASWNCTSGTNVMQLDTVPGECSWPPTMTVTLEGRQECTCNPMSGTC